MKKSTFFSLLTFAVVMVFGAAYITFSVLQYNPLRKYTEVSMKVANANQVVQGTSVLLRGVKIGDVTSVDQLGDGAKINVRYNRTYKIPQDTGVKIEQLSAVGEPFVDFLPDNLDGPYLTNGTEIATSKVKNPLSIPEIFKLVAGLSSNINSKELGGIADTVWQATSGTEGSLPNLQTAGNLASQTILSRMPSIRQMLENTQSYQSDMSWLAPALRGFGQANSLFIEKDIDILKTLDQFNQKANVPDQLTQTINPYLARITPYTNKVLPNLGTIVGPLVPAAAAIEDVAPKIDVSALLSQMLNTFGNDGAANLTVTIPPKK
ncbi:MlaD family protein [Tsukamurella sp. 8F]|uniref:MlaD family protein n=1 Tax=unclassified Tsukamurella TaxID=2633480 RepID=UPI0023B9750D|nr:MULTISPECIES: MlaD family protein [unclassified Tsukamurella]MDF0530302.1 MlaD family protein [Tsukamurella sp. 8J]MDF0587599.1 MlaD family protein [Tsukamurella sp. 8F]